LSARALHGGLRTSDERSTLDSQWGCVDSRRPACTPNPVGSGRNPCCALGNDARGRPRARLVRPHRPPPCHRPPGPATTSTRSRRLGLLPPALLLLATRAAAIDRPRWRGPAGQNVSTETDWNPVGQEDPLWRVDVGRGYSSPVVADGVVYAVGYVEDADERPQVGVDRVSCLDLETGAERWVVEYPALAYANEHAGGALATPTVVEGLVIVPARKGEVRALDAATGAVLWMVDLVQEHGVDPARYGFASSAFSDGDALVLNASRTVMLSRATGETLWISEDHLAGYSTVAPITLGETRGYVVFVKGGLVVVDAATGATPRHFAFSDTPRNVEGATPIVMGTRVFISSAYGHGGALVDCAPEEPERSWRTRRMRNKLAGCTSTRTTCTASTSRC